jgi:large subunit ribosomal protein L23
MLDILIKPVVTEKSMAEVAKGKYTFIVDKAATKSVIKQEIKNKFNVTVIGMTTSIVKGKTKRVGARRVEVTAASFKKASVQLKKGDKIALFEPGSEESK